jgi:hypothetical protein
VVQWRAISLRRIVPQLARRLGYGHGESSQGLCIRLCAASTSRRAAALAIATAPAAAATIIATPFNSSVVATIIATATTVSASSVATSIFSGTRLSSHLTLSDYATIARANITAPIEATTFTAAACTSLTHSPPTILSAATACKPSDLHALQEQHRHHQRLRDRCADR